MDAEDRAARQERLLARAQRAAQALNDDDPGVGPPMIGWFTMDADPLASPDGHRVLPMDNGMAITNAPEVNGVIVPALDVVPGKSYVGAITVKGAIVMIGLQWVWQDGRPGPIVWSLGRKRVSVSGIAPPTARGARLIVAALSAKPADVAARGPLTKAMQVVMAKAAVQLLKDYRGG